jgi:hypothetical protein
VVERKVSGACLACARKNRSEWGKTNKEKLRLAQIERRKANPEKHREHNRRWEKDNPDKVRDMRRRWAEANPDKVRESGRKWREANPDKQNEASRRWTEANREHDSKRRVEYRKANRAKYNALQKRRQATQLKAMPHWLTPEHHAQIVDIYEQAVIAEQLTGVEHHVDHIEPLQGKDRCGLHVPWNLQVLEARENFSKGNRTVRHVLWKKL